MNIPYVYGTHNKAYPKELKNECPVVVTYAEIIIKVAPH